MDSSTVLKVIIDHLQKDPIIRHNNIVIYSHVPPEKAPPYIEVRTVNFQHIIGYKNLSLSLAVRVVSAYLGDSEIENLVACILKNLTTHAFEDEDTKLVFQGRLMERVRKTSNDGRTQHESMNFQFFITSKI